MRKSLADLAAVLLPASWAAAFAGSYFGVPLLAAGAVLSIASAIVLITNKQARVRRQTLKENQAVLATGAEKLLRRAEVVEFQHRQRQQAFQRAFEDLQTQIAHYRAEGDQLKDVFVHYRELKFEEFLRGFSIRDNYRAISGLTASQVAILESYGIDSANDLDRLRLYGIPSIDSEAVMELLQWRMQIDRQFVFNPEHGVSLADLSSSKELAIRRFKMAQARKILSTAKQIQSLVDNGTLDLDYAVNGYTKAAEKWTAAAQQVVDNDRSRLRVERWINASPIRILGLAIGLPALAAAAYFVIRALIV
jgi:DNA-binding helix-hairpin-helix protein with protein kinase domain